MAALAGVDLDRRRSGRPDAVGIGGGFLIAFDHSDWIRVADPLQRFHQQRGLARTGAGDEVERGGLGGLQIVPVFRRDGIIPSENIPLDAQQPRFAGRRLVRMGMIVPMIMLMRSEEQSELQSPMYLVCRLLL